MTARKKKKRAKKAPPTRVPAAERARRSGFHKKLAAWLGTNDQARQDGALTYGPPSAERLAKVLTAMGEPVDPSTVQRWRDGKTLPESRYVQLLERLLGASWAYLDDPKTPWPRKWTREDIADLLDVLPDEEVEEFVQALQQALGRRGRAAKPR